MSNTSPPKHTPRVVVKPSTHQHVPCRHAHTNTKEKRFAEPTRFPTEVVVAMDGDKLSGMENVRGKLKAVSPEETQHALIFAVAREIETKKRPPSSCGLESSLDDCADQIHREGKRSRSVERGCESEGEDRRRVCACGPQYIPTHCASHGVQVEA